MRLQLFSRVLPYGRFRFLCQSRPLQVNALVVGEVDRGQLQPVTLSAVSAACEVTRPSGGSVAMMLTGNKGDLGDAVEMARCISGVGKVYYQSVAWSHPPSPEFLAPMLTSLVRRDHITHLIAGASSFGKDVIPRVAAMLDVSQVSDIIRILDTDTFARPTYAGNAIATVKSLDAIKVLTVRGTAFPKAQVESSMTADLEEVAILPDDDSDSQTAAKVTWLGEERQESVRPQLTSASVVVAGGRGLKSADHFELLEKLADKLGGAVGATRAAVDAGMCSNDMQVGQTGKIVAPQLYIAVGLSGAIQHLAGMKDSKVIVAINKDPQAPIFQVADYGLVADLFEAIPELTDKLPTRE